ncbi:MAG: acetyltransferase [Spongiibacteraceae bacterium]|nr:acetyltransferase [Spongiibacteraceae bacterium]
MFLKERENGHLLAIVNINDLFNPYMKTLSCRGQYGEEEQDPENYPKKDLLFPSDEELPKCWLEPDYRGGSYHHA